MARRDLRLASLVDVPAKAVDRRCSDVCARRFERAEPRHVHRFERELELEARVGRGIELPRRGDRPLAIEIGAVALETQRPRRAAGSSAAGGPRCQRFALERREISAVGDAGLPPFLFGFAGQCPRRFRSGL